AHVVHADPARHPRVGVLASEPQLAALRGGTAQAARARRRAGRCRRTDRAHTGRDASRAGGAMSHTSTPPESVMFRRRLHALVTGAVLFAVGIVLCGLIALDADD